MSTDEFERYATGDDRAPSIESALQRLPSDQRDAVQVRVIDECSYDEVASRLQISEASARKRVSRGLAALRAQLEKEAS
jgi:RNA polymerase sigma-70 factor (ECF subfamily)